MQERVCAIVELDGAKRIFALALRSRRLCDAQAKVFACGANGGGGSAKLDTLFGDACDRARERLPSE